MFHVIPDTPVVPVETLREQKHRYGQDRYSRLPEYRPGHNVCMDPNNFTLYATTKGVVRVRTSRVNSAYKWLDVEPDIQKVARSNSMRAALSSRGMTTSMTRRNEHYRAERDALHDAQWRERVLRIPRLSTRYIDPNLFARGVVSSLQPLDRFVCQ